MNLSWIDKKFIKFLLVGCLNTVFGYSVFAVLIFIKLHYSVAVFIGTVLGILFNFKTTGKLVFNNSNNILIFKFAGVYAITYVLNVVGLYIFDNLKFSLFLAEAILIFPLAMTSFILNKKLVFEGKK